LISPGTRPGHSDAILDYIKKQTVIFSKDVNELSNAVNKINLQDTVSINPAIQALKKARIQYKRISFFLDYFYPFDGKLYNSPAKREVEEPFLEYEEPRGFQVIEAELFKRHAEKNKRYLKDELVVLKESSDDLLSVYFGFEGSDAQVLESMRIELIRIMTLYISGFDAPILKTGIMESLSAIESMKAINKIISNVEDTALSERLRAAAQYLRNPVGFDRFDRLEFLTAYAIPLEEALGKYIKNNGLELNTSKYLDYNGGNLFREEVKMRGSETNKEMSSLGKKLFFDFSLSGNHVRSCSSCHQPGKYFTDQQGLNRTLDNSRFLKRNTATLIYSGYQFAQFWDGRAETLSDQAHDVLMNKEEMAFQTDSGRHISMDTIQAALAAYIRTLSPMNSSFDRFMNGEKNALSEEQKKGFNLFMGKAACGTCHFAPVFNGSTPPFYNRTEYEVLGVPEKNNAQRNKLDPDLGRYTVYPVDVYRRAFKTPTVRNVQFTQPYMHNGVFKNLDEVMNFYNLGGGRGMGLKVPEQSLPDKPLHLSKKEKLAIIAFLNALTDSLNNIN